MSAHLFLKLFGNVFSVAQADGWLRPRPFNLDGSWNVPPSRRSPNGSAPHLNRSSARYPELNYPNSSEQHLGPGVHFLSSEQLCNPFE